MGDFSKETNINKKFSRIGQSFSTTRHFGEIDPKDIIVIDDFERNGHIFTDGCGYITRELADKISNKLFDGIYHSAF